jgi:hypothetical protein
LWSQESLFLQTPQKHIFLETVLLQMSHQVNIEDLKTLLKQAGPANKPAQTKPESSPTKNPFVAELEQIMQKRTTQAPEPQAHQKPKPKSPFSPSIDVSDDKKWPQANLLTKHFSGKLEKVKDVE